LAKKENGSIDGWGKKKKNNGSTCYGMSKFVFWALREIPYMFLVINPYHKEPHYCGYLTICGSYRTKY